MTVAIAAAIGLIALIWLLLNRHRSTVKDLADCLLDPSATFKIAKALAVLAVLLIFAYMAFKAVSSGSSDIIGLLSDGAMVCTYIVVLVLELFFGYLIAFRRDIGEEAVLALLMFAALAIMIWPPIPQYLLIFVPFMAVYVAMYRPVLARPLMLAGLLFVVYDLLLGNVAMFYGLAYDFGLISYFTLESVNAFFRSSILGLSWYDLINFFVCAAGQLLLVYIVYRWYRETEGLGILSTRGSRDCSKPL